MARRTALAYLDEFVTRTADAGVLHCAAEDERLTGRTVRILKRDRTHFGSCSYLGLEMDDRLRAGVHDAVDRYGTQFSSSRSYLSSPLYAELETQLERIFGGHVLVTPSTTLGHLAALPALVEKDDALILDHQVHHSVHTAVQVARREGCHVELVPHGDLEELDQRVKELAPKHRRVWILADGVYSMFGDLAPVDHLWALSERYPNLWLYIDDAHGMGWCGPRGCGSVLSRVPLHERVIMATSLNKSFAAGGGCLVFGDPEARRRVFTVGGPMIFAGPVQPPMLGAALASAELHLSDELPLMQAELRDRIEECTNALEERGLPLVASDLTPIRFVGIGLPRVARNLAARLLEDGYFVNVSHFPAVPMRKAGIRFTLTRHHRTSDLIGLADALERNFEAAFEEEGQNSDSIWRTFGLAPRPQRRQPPEERHVDRYSSIHGIDRAEWNGMFADHGALDWESLQMLEELFDAPDQPSRHWKFQYYIVRDLDGRPLVATLFTRALWKLDMMESEAVSREVERRREQNPDFLVAPVFGMGTLLTEGNHLYVNRERLPSGSPGWEKALQGLLGAVRADAEELEVQWVALRDLPSDDAQLDFFLTGHGFLRQDAPDRFALDVATSEEELRERLPSRHRRFQRKEVDPWNDEYEVSIIDASNVDAAELDWERCDRLYAQLQARSLEINTFPLPPGYFRKVAAQPNWELLVLKPKNQPASEPVAILSAARGEGRYAPMVIGMDEGWIQTRGLYRQALRAVIQRARELGARKLELGFGASLQKRRFGAELERSSVYIQAEDHYALDVLAEIKAELGLGTA